MNPACAVLQATIRKPLALEAVHLSLCVEVGLVLRRSGLVPVDAREEKLPDKELRSRPDDVAFDGVFGNAARNPSLHAHADHFRHGPFNTGTDDGPPTPVVGAGCTYAVPTAPIRSRQRLQSRLRTRAPSAGRASRSRNVAPRSLLSPRDPQPCGRHTRWWWSSLATHMKSRSWISYHGEVRACRTRQRPACGTGLLAVAQLEASVRLGVAGPADPRGLLLSELVRYRLRPRVRMRRRSIVPRTRRGSCSPPSPTGSRSPRGRPSRR